MVFAKTRSPSLALKCLLSYVIAWDTTCIYQQFNAQQFPIPLIIFIVDISNLCGMCGSADLHDNWTACMPARQLSVL